MAQIINTNVTSLLAQRNLNVSSKAMQTSIQRLSSSLRINSAKDDAAGLAISERMTAQINGMKLAVRNANDGISLAQVAEGAMQESTNILQRMRELSVQSANAVNSTLDRESMQNEVAQLQSELDRVAFNTEFNGQRVIDGSFTNATFQVGANANQTISFSIGNVQSSAIGGIGQQTGTAVSASASTDITVALGTGPAVVVGSSAGFTGTANGQDATSAYAKAGAIKAAGINGLSVTASTSGTQALGTIGHGGATDTYDLSINGVDIYKGQSVTAGLDINTLAKAINTSSNDTGVVASISSSGNLTLTAADGRNISVTEGGTNFVAGTDGISVTGGAFDSTASPLRGNISISAIDYVTIGGTVANNGLSSFIANDNKGINEIDISTVDGAQTAIQRIDAAINSVGTARADLGAIQNRFDLTIENLQNVSDNLSAARSQIKDVDYAAETASLTKNQILQQAGTAMLAQANSLPQSVLSLLGH